MSKTALVEMLLADTPLARRPGPFRDAWIALRNAVVRCESRDEVARLLRRYLDEQERRHFGSVSRPPLST